MALSAVTIVLKLDMVDGVDSNGAVDGDHFVRDLNFYLGLNIPQK